MKTAKIIGLLLIFIYFELLVAGAGALVYYSMMDISPIGLHKYPLRMALATMTFLTTSFCSFATAVLIMPRKKMDFNILRHPIRFIKLSSSSLN